MDDDAKDRAAERLIREADKHGISVTKVTDGHVMVFTKAHLVGILAKMEASGQEKALVFIKDRSTIN